MLAYDNNAQTKEAILPTTKSKPAKRRKVKPDPLAPLRGLVPHEQLRRGDIAANDKGGGTVLDWADKLHKRGHFDAQGLAAFRAFEALQEALASGGGIDPSAPKVSGGKSDAFSLRKLGAGQKLKRIYECIGAANYEVLTKMSGARSSKDLDVDLDREKKVVAASGAVIALAAHLSTVRNLVRG